MTRPRNCLSGMPSVFPWSKTESTPIPVRVTTNHNRLVGLQSAMYGLKCHTCVFFERLFQVERNMRNTTPQAAYY